MDNAISSGDLLTKEELSRHIKIYAGPGAGKTHFLVENVKNIVTHNEQIINGNNRKVLCITYTNAAVDEIIDRLDKYTNYVECYTIHGFIIEHIIKPFQNDLIKLMKSDFEINVNKKGKISSQVEGLGILHGIDKEEIYNFIRNKNNTVRTLEYSKTAMGSVEIDNSKVIDFLENGVTCKDGLKKTKKMDVEDVKPIKEYLWSVVRKLTHDEILYFGCRILQFNSLALYTLRVKFPFIFVDEFQDTNPIQTLILKLIGEKSSIIGVVGDIAQSIYSFQGAKPMAFLNFKLLNDDKEYVIEGNRRSTENIINFCNFLRKSDSNLIQKSEKQYENKCEQNSVESKKIHFLMGSSTKIKNSINLLIVDDAVILTRTWSAAFNYIQGVTEEQSTILKKIYNSYYSSPIQLKDEISEYNNVTWVRAFRFIFNLWNSYKSNSFIDVINALKLFCEIDIKSITPKVIIEIKKLSDNLFKSINEKDLTCDIIDKFNKYINEDDFLDFRLIISDELFNVNIFSEFDREKLIDYVKDLQWETSYKLFNEVFSDDSRYMTVHQAKGLEWDKVIVSVSPTRKDKTSLENMFSSPQINKEQPSDEFTRIYYVACSRAKKDLYIHVEDIFLKSIIENSLNTFIKDTEMVIDYEFIE